MTPPFPPASSSKDTREWTLSVDAHTQTSGVILMNLDIKDGAVIGRSLIVHVVPRSRLEEVERERDALAKALESEVRRRMIAEVPHAD